MKLNFQWALFALVVSNAITTAAAQSSAPATAVPVESASAPSQGKALEQGTPPTSASEPESCKGSMGSSATSPIFVSTPEDPNSKVIAYWTIVLGVFTAILAVLAVIQAWMLKQQGRDVALSAEAAKRSADIAASALTKLERPLVFVNLQTMPSKTAEHPDVVVFNFGRSPAMLRLIAYSGVDLQSGQIPPQAVPMGQERKLPYGTIILNPVSHHEESAFFATPNAAPGMERWFHGRVTYVDMLDEKYSLSFAFKWDQVQGKWQKHFAMNGLTKL